MDKITITLIPEEVLKQDSEYRRIERAKDRAFCASQDEIYDKLCRLQNLREHELGIHSANGYPEFY